MAKSYIKIYGPPVSKAIKVLENIALEFPETCISDILIASSVPPLDTSDVLYKNLNELGTSTTITRCRKMISKSGETLGEYDFFFEWLKNPTQDDINRLIEKIDVAFASLRCRYTITTKQ